MARRPPIAGFFMTSLFPRQNRFHWSRWPVKTVASLRRIIAPCGQPCVNLRSFASTRVRAGGRNSDRQTGNVAAALFTHDTSRALDPHLHTHCIVFNATFDAVENRWKALQNYELLRARKFAENAYYHELARELRSFGYSIRNRISGDFQIEGVSEELCDRFSKRDRQIDKAVAKLLAEKPEMAGANIKDLRERLAGDERSRKQKDLSREELQLSVVCPDEQSRTRFFAPAFQPNGKEFCRG